MNEKKYDEDGYLIISETDSCPLWEKDTIPSTFACTKDCFYCRYTDFRTDEYIRRAEEMPRGKPLYSICRNEKNCIKKSSRNVLLRGLYQMLCTEKGTRYY